MNQKIVPLNKDMTWVDAFFATKEKGGLPSNLLHDETLQNDSIWEQLKKLRYYGAWAREIIVYPEKDGVFAKGNIEDHYKNWIIPSKHVPKNIIGKKGIALVIDPKDVVVSNGTTTIIPRTVYVQSFPQEDGLYDFDKKTRIPIDADPKGDNYWDARKLWRWDEQSVRPLARYYGDFGRRAVDAVWGHDVRLGVGVVSPSEK